MAPPHLSILVLDDDDHVRDILTRLLRFQGHTVEAASCGTDALALFRPGKFNLVITDLAMPEMTGDVFATAIKAACPTQPIIMFTAYATGSSQHPMPQVDYLLTKPFQLHELQNAIATVTADRTPEPARVT